MRELIEYDNSFMVYYQVAADISSDCNDILFLNQGTNTVVINNLLSISPNQAWSPGGNVNEIDRTRYSITFNGAGTSKCIVIRKTYRHSK